MTILLEKRLRSVWTPVLTCAAVGALLTGCGPSTTPSTSMDDSASTAGGTAMMNDDGAKNQGDDAMKGGNQYDDGMMQSSASSAPQADAGMMAGAYADGTYSATGNYTSPAGPEEINVSLTIKNGAVVDGTYMGKAAFGKSQMYQQAFGQGFLQAVQGKSLDSLSVGVVNGASLTSMGFQDALAKIKAEAKA